MKRGLILLVVTGLFAGAVALIGGFLGAWHPIGDSLAVFRAYLGVPIVLGALGLFAARWWRWFAGLVGLIGAVSLGSIFVVTSGVDPDAKDFSLYQKNMLNSMADPVGFGQDVVAQGSDFVTLQEISLTNRSALAEFGPVYPARQFCEFGKYSSIAVFSRLPAVKDSGFCSRRFGLAGLQVKTPQGPLWVLSVHLRWPWPYTQARQMKMLTPMFEALQGPVLIGGDFNMVPWSHRLRSIADATGTTRIGSAQATATEFNGLLRVSIDHVLVTGGQGAVERLPQMGSDHFGLLARFSLDAELTR